MRRIGLVLAACGLLGIAAPGLWYGGSAALADARSLPARWVVSGWRTGKGPAFTPELWLQTRDDLRQALKIAPGNPQLHDDLGFLHATRARGMGDPEAGSAAYRYQQLLLDESIASYRRSAALRPTFPYAWVYLALAKHLRGQQDAEFWLAFDNAIRYGHSEAGVQPPLAEIAFAHWKTLDPQRQQRITHLVNTANAQVKIRLQELASLQHVELILSPN